MELKIQIDETMFKDIIEKELAAFSKEELHEIIRGMIEESMRNYNLLRDLFFIKQTKWYDSTEYEYVPGQLLKDAARTFDLSPVYKEIQEKMINELKENYKPILEKIMLSLMIKGLSDSYDFQGTVCRSVTDIMNSYNK